MSTEKSTENTNCKVCNKKSIYNMKCRCENYYCRKHFEVSKHSCTFDFCKHSVTNLGNKLEKIENDKVVKIN